MLLVGWLVGGWLVTFVNCAKTAGRIETKFGTKVGGVRVNSVPNFVPIRSVVFAQCTFLCCPLSVRHYDVSVINRNHRHAVQQHDRLARSNLAARSLGLITYCVGLVSPVC